VLAFTAYSYRLRSNMDKQIASFDSETWYETVTETEDENIEVIDIDETVNAEAEKSTEKAPPEFQPAIVTSAAPEKVAEKEEFKMEMPCNGNVISPCSVDELVFCETMQDWRTHNGLDIAGNIGDQVKAAEAGVVSEVYSDELLGTVVVIDHENGISSLYANLQNPDFISVGAKVAKGDIIGGIGKSGSLEANLEPHLHFEVIADGEYKNPKDMIKN